MKWNYYAYITTLDDFSGITDDIHVVLFLHSFPLNWLTNTNILNYFLWYSFWKVFIDANFWFYINRTYSFIMLEGIFFCISDNNYFVCTQLKWFFMCIDVFNTVLYLMVYLWTDVVQVLLWIVYLNVSELSLPSVILTLDMSSPMDRGRHDSDIVSTVHLSNLKKIPSLSCSIEPSSEL